MIMYIEMLCVESDITHMQLMRGSRKFCKRESNFDNDDGPKLIVQGIQTRIAKKSFIFVISRGDSGPSDLRSGSAHGNWNHILINWP